MSEFVSGEFPTSVNTKAVTYPIKRYADRQIGFLGKSFSDDSLWLMQQQIFNAKMDLLKAIVREGHLPCKPAMIEVEVRVLQEVLPSEATDGKVIELPSHMKYFSAYKYDYKESLNALFGQ